MHQAGADTVKQMLSKKGYTVRGWAKDHGEHWTNVSRCIRNRRPLPRVRAKLARTLRMSQSRLASLIEG